MLTNTCSLLNKYTEVTHNILLTQSHVTSICETWLTDDIFDHELAIPEFCIFRKDRLSNRKGGRVMLIVHSCLQPVQLDLPPATCTLESIDIVGWVVRVGRKKVAIFQINRSPSSSSIDDNILAVNISEFSRKHQDVVIIGELNCPQLDWNNMQTPAGTFDDQLLTCAEEYFLH